MRSYYLSVQPLSNKCRSALRYVGADAKTSKTPSEFRASLEKARSGCYGEIVLAPNYFEWNNFPSGLDALEEFEFEKIIQLTPQIMNDLPKDTLQLIEDCNLKIEVLIDSDNFEQFSKAMKGIRSNQIKRFVFLMTKKLDPFPLLLWMDEHQINPYFYFPLGTNKHLIYSAKEALEWVQKIRNRFPKFTMTSPPGRDIFQPRIPEDQELEPMLETSFERGVCTQTPLISLVIPSFNDKVRIKLALESVFLQTLPVESYEVIIVDDGSSDGTEEELREWLRAEPNLPHVKFVHFPRSRPRKMGDFSFRAGVARNLGVKHARASILLFLDSDILIPPNYLSNLLELHRSYDVIQSRRWELSPSCLKPDLNFDEARDLTLPIEGPFWKYFYQATPEWREIEDGWKYTCTHSLSVKTELFKEVGWFRKSFDSYGYEDAELGWRLWQSKAWFRRNNLDVLHLPHPKDRSEFANRHTRKVRLLSQSAPTFYLNTLDDKVYQHCRYLFDPLLPVKLLVRHCIPKQYFNFSLKRGLRVQG